MKPAFDPVPRALEIVCPVCAVGRDKWCRTPKRTARKRLHRERIKMVMP